MRKLYWTLFKEYNAHFIDTRDTVFGLSEDIANFLVEHGLYKGSIYGFAFKNKRVLEKLCFIVSMCENPEDEFHAQFYSLSGTEPVIRKFGSGSVIERAFRENFVIRSSFDLGIRDKGSYMLVAIDFRNDISLYYDYCGKQKLPPDALHLSLIHI